MRSKPGILFSIGLLIVSLSVVAYLASNYVTIHHYPSPLTMKARKDWLNQGSSNEVRILGPLSLTPSWVATVTIDLDKKTLFGGAGNGISISPPYHHTRQGGTPLTDDQWVHLQPLLHQLPSDGSDSADPNFSEELHVTFFENGLLQVRHYPYDHLPGPILQIGKLLQLWMPEQK